MRPLKQILFLSAFSLLSAAPAFADNAPWSYTGGKSASNWSTLSPEYLVCKNGKAQSPVNIEKYVQRANAPQLDLNYAPTPLEVMNNGNTVQVNYAAGSTLNSDGETYALKHFDFHTPSEHYIDGAPYPMEVQLMHQTADGRVVGIAVMLKLGEHNPVIEGIWQNVPAVGEVKSVAMVDVNAADLLPADKGYYSYNGSLTTPPCSENVKWFVMKDPIELSLKQLTAFQSVFPVNARPVQGLNGRTIRGN